jgi:hypothetical protein
LADPKEIITTHLVDSEDGVFDYIQFFHAFYRIWVIREEAYTPRTHRECLLNWLYYSKIHSPDLESKAVSESSDTDSNLLVFPPAADFPLTPGETVHKVYDLVQWSLGAKGKSGASFSGRMFVTDFRIVLEVGEESKDASNVHSRYRIAPYFDQLTVPLHSLGKVANDANCLVLTVKDTRVVTLSCSARGHKKPFAEEALLLIHRFAFPGSMRQLKLFAFRPAAASREGWEHSDILREYRRMRITECPEWKVYDNSEGKLCDTYPSHVVVPSKVKGHTSKLYCICTLRGFVSVLLVWSVLAVAEHRSKSRLPVVTYRHLANGAVLLRSAQPMVGLTLKSSSDDELIMECYRLRNRSLDSKYVAFRT